MNIEEVSFEGSHVTLVVDSWGHGHEQQMEANWNWQPQGSATNMLQILLKYLSVTNMICRAVVHPMVIRNLIFMCTENSDGTGSAVTTSDGSAVCFLE